MRVPFFQLDAFATVPFTGNPAAVMCLDSYPEDSVLQAIAAENNLAETAFLVPEGPDYCLRWFTPLVEVPLCGHATLASAAVVMERFEKNRTEVVFQSASGPLVVRKTSRGYLMSLPSRPSMQVEAPSGLAEALGREPKLVYRNEFNYLALFDDRESLKSLSPTMEKVVELDRPGVIVTAPGDDRYDFYSRYFAPKKGISEDPVTGAAHCMLAPFWSPRLGKGEFRAFQASKRGGQVICRLAGDRVELEGACVFYLEGEAEI